MSGPTSTSLDPESQRTTRRRLLQGLGALAAAPWIAPAGAADRAVPLRLPLHLTQMVNHIGISVRDVRKSASFYSHLLDEAHILGQEKPTLRYLINLHPGAISVGPLSAGGPSGHHTTPFIDHFAVLAQPFNLASWRARLDALKIRYFAQGTFVPIDGVPVQLLGGHEAMRRRRARKGPAGAGFMPMAPLYTGEPLVKAHGFKRVTLQMANLDAATEEFRTLFGLPPHRTDSGRVFFQIADIQLELQDAPSGPSRIAAFAIKVEPFDRAKVSEALEALGAKVEATRGGGNPAALPFADPDGIECELWPL